MKIQLSALIDSKLIKINAALNFLFQIYSDCFKLYKLFNSLNTDNLS